MPWMSNPIPGPFPPAPTYTGAFTPLKFFQGPPVIRQTRSNSLARSIIKQMQGPPILSSGPNPSGIPIGPTRYMAPKPGGPPVLTSTRFPSSGAHLGPTNYLYNKLSGPPVLTAARFPSSGAHMGPTSPPNTRILASSGPPVLVRPGRFILQSFGKI